MTPLGTLQTDHRLNKRCLEDEVQTLTAPRPSYSPGLSCWGGLGFGPPAKSGEEQCVWRRWGAGERVRGPGGAGSWEPQDPQSDLPSRLPGPPPHPRVASPTSFPFLQLHPVTDGWGVKTQLPHSWGVSPASECPWGPAEAEASLQPKGSPCPAAHPEINK